jgi:AcrR family transcriptional regulator
VFRFPLHSGSMSAGETARARVRAEITAEILAAAREELVTTGAAGLSLRSVARRLGMVPSALYRYFPSRDALLTALIVDAYEAVGAAAETAAGSTQEPPMSRWLALSRAVRIWAAEHPQQWALIYGSPVTGYEAPRDTVVAALQITYAVAAIFSEAKAAGDSLPDPPVGLAGIVAPMGTELLPGRPPQAVVAALLAWTQLIGMVSLELFGHYKGATTDFEAVFEYAMTAIGHLGGLEGAGPGG